MLYVEHSARRPADQALPGLPCRGRRGLLVLNRKQLPASPLVGSCRIHLPYPQTHAEGGSSHAGRALSFSAGVEVIGIRGSEILLLRQLCVDFALVDVMLWDA